jgi:hypothetical protein
MSANSIIGIPLHQMVTPIVRGGAQHEMPERIANLSVPVSYATVPHTNPTSYLKFKNSNPVFTYSTIPDDIYDKLLNLVSVHNTNRSRKRKPAMSRAKTSKHLTSRSENKE